MNIYIIHSQVDDNAFTNSGEITCVCHSVFIVKSIRDNRLHSSILSHHITQVIQVKHQVTMNCKGTSLD